MGAYCEPHIPQISFSYLLKLIIGILCYSSATPLHTFVTVLKACSSRMLYLLMELSPS
jgi:hypothetical protein